MANTFKQALKDNKQAKTTTKKSSVVTIQNIPARIQKKSEEFVRLNQQKKEIETELKAISDGIIDYTRGYQDAEGFAGNFAKSFNVGDVQVVTKNAYSINANDEAQIKKVLGRAYSEMIEERFTIKVKDEVMASTQLQEELMALLGDNFSKFFDVESSLFVKDDFDKDIYKVAGTQEKLDEIRTFIKPYKPSVK